ncbi:E3 ubiquitin-protein ligase tom1 [Gurleya vavrai]
MRFQLSTKTSKNIQFFITTLIAADKESFLAYLQRYTTNWPFPRTNVNSWSNLLAYFKNIYIDHTTTYFFGQIQKKEFEEEDKKEIIKINNFFKTLLENGTSARLTSNFLEIIYVFIFSIDFEVSLHSMLLIRILLNKQPRSLFAFKSNLKTNEISEFFEGLQCSFFKIDDKNQIDFNKENIYDINQKFIEQTYDNKHYIKMILTYNKYLHKEKFKQLHYLAGSIYILVKHIDIYNNPCIIKLIKSSKNDINQTENEYLKTSIFMFYNTCMEKRVELKLIKTNLKLSQHDGLFMNELKMIQHKNYYFTKAFFEFIASCCITKVEIITALIEIGMINEFTKILRIKDNKYLRLKYYVLKILSILIENQHFDFFEIIDSIDIFDDIYSEMEHCFKNLPADKFYLFYDNFLYKNNSNENKESETSNNSNEYKIKKLDLINIKQIIPSSKKINYSAVENDNEKNKFNKNEKNQYNDNEENQTIENEKNQSNDHYETYFFYNKIIKFGLKCVNSLQSNRNQGNRQIQDIFECKLASLLEIIFKNYKVYSYSILNHSLCCIVNYINHHPLNIIVLQEKNILPLLFDIFNDIPINTSVILTLVDLINGLTLRKELYDDIIKEDLLFQIFNILIDEKYLEITYTTDLNSQLGISVEELARHHPIYRKNIGFYFNRILALLLDKDFYDKYLDNASIENLIALQKNIFNSIDDDHNYINIYQELFRNVLIFFETLLTPDYFNDDEIFDLIKNFVKIISLPLFSFYFEDEVNEIVLAFLVKSKDVTKQIFLKMTDNILDIFKNFKEDEVENFIKIIVDDDFKISSLCRNENSNFLDIKSKNIQDENKTDESIIEILKDFANINVYDKKIQLNCNSNEAKIYNLLITIHRLIYFLTEFDYSKVEKKDFLDILDNYLKIIEYCFNLYKIFIKNSNSVLLKTTSGFNNILIKDDLSYKKDDSTKIFHNLTSLIYMNHINSLTLIKYIWNDLLNFDAEIVALYTQKIFNLFEISNFINCDENSKEDFIYVHASETYYFVNLINVLINDESFVFFENKFTYFCTLLQKIVFTLESFNKQQISTNKIEINNKIRFDLNITYLNNTRSIPIEKNSFETLIKFSAAILHFLYILIDSGFFKFDQTHHEKIKRSIHLYQDFICGEELSKAIFDHSKWILKKNVKQVNSYDEFINLPETKLHNIENIFLDTLSTIISIEKDYDLDKKVYFEYLIKNKKFKLINTLQKNSKLCYYSVLYYSPFFINQILENISDITKNNELFNILIMNLLIYNFNNPCTCTNKNYFKKLVRTNEKCKKCMSAFKNLEIKNIKDNRNCKLHLIDNKNNLKKNKDTFHINSNDKLQCSKFTTRCQAHYPEIYFQLINFSDERKSYDCLSMIKFHILNLKLIENNYLNYNKESYFENLNLKNLYNQITNLKTTEAYTFFNILIFYFLEDKNYLRNVFDKEKTNFNNGTMNKNIFYNRNHIIFSEKNKENINCINLNTEIRKKVISELIKIICNEEQPILALQILTEIIILYPGTSINLKDKKFMNFLVTKFISKEIEDTKNLDYYKNHWAINLFTAIFIRTNNLELKKIIADIIIKNIKTGKEKQIITMCEFMQKIILQRLPESKYICTLDCCKVKKKEKSVDTSVKNTTTANNTSTNVSINNISDFLDNLTDTMHLSRRTNNESEDFFDNGPNIIGRLRREFVFSHSESSCLSTEFFFEKKIILCLLESNATEETIPSILKFLESITRQKNTSQDLFEESNSTFLSEEEEETGYSSHYESNSFEEEEEIIFEEEANTSVNDNLFIHLSEIRINGVYERWFYEYNYFIRDYKNLFFFENQDNKKYGCLDLKKESIEVFNTNHSGLVSNALQIDNLNINSALLSQNLNTINNNSLLNTNLNNLNENLSNNSQNNLQTPMQNTIEYNNGLPELTTLIPEGDGCTWQDDCNCFECMRESSESSIGDYNGEYPDLDPSFINELPRDLAREIIENFYEERRRTSINYIPINTNFLDSLNEEARNIFEEFEVRFKEDFEVENDSEIEEESVNESFNMRNNNSFIDLKYIDKILDLVYFNVNDRCGMNFLNFICGNEKLRKNVVNKILNNIKISNDKKLEDTLNNKFDQNGEEKSKININYKFINTDTKKIDLNNGSKKRKVAKDEKKIYSLNDSIKLLHFLFKHQEDYKTHLNMNDINLIFNIKNVSLNELLPILAEMTEVFYNYTLLKQVIKNSKGDDVCFTDDINLIKIESYKNVINEEKVKENFIQNTVDKIKILNDNKFIINFPNENRKYEIKTDKIKNIINSNVAFYTSKYVRIENLLNFLRNDINKEVMEAVKLFIHDTFKIFAYEYISFLYDEIIKICDALSFDNFEKIKKLEFLFSLLKDIRLKGSFNSIYYYLCYEEYNRKRKIVENHSIWKRFYDFIGKNREKYFIISYINLFESFCILRKLRFLESEYKKIENGDEFYRVYDKSIIRNSNEINYAGNKNETNKTNEEDEKIEKNENTSHELVNKNLNVDLSKKRNTNDSQNFTDQVSIEEGKQKNSSENISEKESLSVSNNTSEDFEYSVSEETNEEFNSFFKEIAENNKNYFNFLVENNTNAMVNSFNALLHLNIFEFQNKRNYLKQIFKKSGLFSMFLNIDRNSLFEDSYNQIMAKSGNDFMRSRINVKFVDEEGVDVGGLTREFFNLLSKEIVKPDYCLFVLNQDGRTYSINKSSHVNHDHLLYFRFVGKFIAKGIIDEVLTDIYFTKPFYKQVLGKNLSLKDLESVDNAFYKSLKWMQENSIEGVFEQNFSWEYEEFGIRKYYELIENGRNIEVTDENKNLYIEKVADFIMTQGCEMQMKSFRDGFFEVMEEKYVRIFNENELELLINGLPEIDVDDWRNNTDYYGYKNNSREIEWFWRCVRGMNNEDKARLLQFVTGTSNLPIDGFKGLQGNNGRQKFQIHCGGKGLPCAHTCFNQLDLPKYASYEELVENLLYAIRECSTGFGFA